MKIRFPRLHLKNCIMAVAGSAILAFGLYNVHSLSGVTEGGILGLTLLLKHWLNISPAVTSLVMNFACYTFGFFTLGLDFMIYSAIAGGSFSLFYAICEAFPPIYPEISSMPLAASIIGAIFVGVGVGICVRGGSAPSGDDALAMGLEKLTRVRIQWVYLASDLTVLALSATYIPVARLLYSLLTVVISGQLVGFVQRAKFSRKGH